MQRFENQCILTLKLQQNLEAITADHRVSIDPSHMIFTQLRSFLAKNPIQFTSVH